MKYNCNPVKGMRDLLPDDLKLRNYVTSQILGVYEQYGFSQIETPCVEKIAFLSSGEGGDNEKMLFNILKRGEKLNLDKAQNRSDLIDLALRFDLTVPLCRFYANNKSKLPNVFKSIQIGNVWRAERPQKGRFRQFTQCDIDIIGDSSVVTEIEIILATSKALQSISFEGFTVKINDRRILESLVSYCGFESKYFTEIFIVLDKFDKIGIEGIEQELKDKELSSVPTDKLLSILNSLPEKADIEQVAELIPNIPQNIINEIKTVINIIQRQAQGKFSIQFDLSLVRGMGYYTGQIFEMQAKDYGVSIAGGGRYNKMIGKFLALKEEIPACGFSIGFERVIDLLKQQEFTVSESSQKIALLYDAMGAKIQPIFEEADRLREDGYLVSIEIMNVKKMKRQLTELKQRGFSYFAVYSEQDDLTVKPIN